MFDSHFLRHRQKGRLLYHPLINSWECRGRQCLPTDYILSRTRLAMAQKERQTTGDRNKKHKPLIEIDPKERNII